MNPFGASLLLASVLASGTQAQQSLETAPWSVVHTTEQSAWNNVDWIDLVALDENSLVACYQRSGGRYRFGGTFVLRSRDAGRSWQLVQSLSEFNSGSLVWDGAHVWLIGLLGELGQFGRPAVSRALDADVTGFGPPSLLRGTDWLESAQTSIVQGGRVWRVFRRSMIVTCVQRREQLLVASAPLGKDLEQASSWQWSGELPSDCLSSGHGGLIRFVDDATPLLHFTVEAWSESRPVSVIEVLNEGWSLKIATPAPAWHKLPHGADRLQRPSDASAFFAVDVDTTHAGEDRSELPMNVVTVARSPELQDWTTSVLLHDARETPLHFAAGTVRILPKGDLAVLFSLRTNMQRGQHAAFTAPSTLAFLRVPRIADRKASDPPLWGPPVPR